jgi:hypothetical protein
MKPVYGRLRRAAPELVRKAIEGASEIFQERSFQKLQKKKVLKT